MRTSTNTTPVSQPGLEAEKRAFLLFCMAHGVKYNVVNAAEFSADTVGRVVGVPLGIATTLIADPQIGYSIGRGIIGFVGGTLGAITSPLRVFHLYQTRNVQYSGEEVSELVENLESEARTSREFEERSAAYENYEQCKLNAEKLDLKLDSTHIFSDAYLKTLQDSLEEMIRNAIGKYQNDKKIFSNMSASSASLLEHLKKYKHNLFKRAQFILEYLLDNQANKGKRLHNTLSKQKGDIYLLSKQYIALENLHCAVAKMRYFNAAPNIEKPTMSEAQEKSTKEFLTLVENITSNYKPSFTSSESSKKLYLTLISRTASPSEKQNALRVYMTKKSDYCIGKNHLYNQGKKLFNVVAKAMKNASFEPNIATRHI